MEWNDPADIQLVSRTFDDWAAAVCAALAYAATRNILATIVVGVVAVVVAPHLLGQ